MALDIYYMEPDLPGTPLSDDCMYGTGRVVCPIECDGADAFGDIFHLNTYNNYPRKAWIQPKHLLENNTKENVFIKPQPLKELDTYEILTEVLGISAFGGDLRRCQAYGQRHLSALRFLFDLNRHGQYGVAAFKDLVIAPNQTDWQFMKGMRTLLFELSTLREAFNDVLPSDGFRFTVQGDGRDLVLCLRGAEFPLVAYAYRNFIKEEAPPRLIDSMNGKHELEGNNNNQQKVNVLCPWEHEETQNKYGAIGEAIPAQEPPPKETLAVIWKNGMPKLFQCRELPQPIPAPPSPPVSEVSDCSTDSMDLIKEYDALCSASVDSQSGSLGSVSPLSVATSEESFVII